MNIEESINLLEWANLNKLYIETYNECDYHNIYKAVETLLTAYEKEKALAKNHKVAFEKQTENLHEVEELLEKEKEKNKELEEKIIHRYKRICPECNNSFIAKRNNTKYCQKCSKKVARRKYKEANKEKIREYSKLHMRKYRAKKKLLKEE